LGPLFGLVTPGDFGIDVGQERRTVRSTNELDVLLPRFGSDEDRSSGSLGRRLEPGWLHYFKRLDLVDLRVPAPNPDPTFRMGAVASHRYV
jgi:hypothetical protein